MCNNSFAQSENVLYSKIIDESKNEISEKSLSEKINSLQENLSDSQKKQVSIIYKVLLANLISTQNNEISNKTTNLYKEALFQAEKTNNLGLQIWVETQIGYYYYRFYRYDFASDYFFNVSRFLNESLNDDLVDPITVLKYNAYFYTSINEKQISNNYLKRTLNQDFNDKRDYGAILNAIGTNYYNLGKYQSANHYFKKTIEFSKSINDSLRLAKGYGDLAQIYILNKHYNKAEKLLLQDIEISKNVNNQKNLLFAQIRLAKLYLLQKEHTQAKLLFNSALRFVTTDNTFKSWESDINKSLLTIALYEKNTHDELNLRRRLDYLRPIVDTIDGAELLKKISWKNQNEIANWKFESEQIKLEKESFMKTTFIIISTLLLCLLILFVFFYKRRFKLQQAKYENSILSAQLTQIKTEKDLIKAKNSLKSIKTYLVNKNKQIVKLEDQLKDLVHNSKEDFSQKRIELDSLISSHLMTDENWIMFKESFKNEEPEAYNYIKSNFPDISDGNLRIILLNRIGLKNQEIANLLGITISGVKKAKQRLRLKYGETIEI